MHSTCPGWQRESSVLFPDSDRLRQSGIRIPGGGLGIILYYVPSGTENALFGAGVVMRVTIGWSSTGASLYLNNTLVKSVPLYGSNAELVGGIELRSGSV